MLTDRAVSTGLGADGGTALSIKSEVVGSLALLTFLSGGVVSTVGDGRRWCSTLLLVSRQKLALLTGGTESFRSGLVSKDTPRDSTGRAFLGGSVHHVVGLTARASILGGIDEAVRSGSLNFTFVGGLVVEIGSVAFLTSCGVRVDLTVGDFSGDCGTGVRGVVELRVTVGASLSLVDRLSCFSSFSTSYTTEIVRSQAL